MGCKRCGGDNGWSCLDDLCSKCIRREYVKYVLPISLIVLILVTFIGAILGHINYGYEYNKCTNLKDPTYEFTHDVQLNVEYTENCYYITSHPLAYFGYVSSGFLLGIFLTIFSILYIPLRGITQ